VISKNEQDFTKWSRERLPGDRECMKDLRVMTVLEKDEHSHENGTPVVLEYAVFRSWKIKFD